MLRSLMAIIKPVLMFFPAVITATTTTSEVDNQGFGSLALTFAVGTMAFSGTDKLTITIEHSDTSGSGFVAVGDGDLASAEVAASGIFKVLDAGTEDESVFTCDYVGAKRYVRAVLTEEGTVSVALSVVALQGHPNAMPVR